MRALFEPLRLRSSLTADEFMNILEKFERMSADELARFRTDPQNEKLVREYDAFARAQWLRAVVPLVTIFVISVLAGLHVHKLIRS